MPPRRREELIEVLNKNSYRVEDLAMHFGVTKIQRSIDGSSTMGFRRRSGIIRRK